MISIITVTKNASNVLERLVSCLRNQISQDFEWIVVDGASTDNTIDIIQQNSDVIDLYVIEEDFGIYDAINKGIKMCTTSHYVVVGADDYVYPDYVANYNQMIAENPDADILTCQVKYKESVLCSREGDPIIHGIHGITSGHAVGTLVRTNIHRALGYYSIHYKIASDCEFMCRVHLAGMRFVKCNFIGGEFAPGGVSSNRLEGTIETYLAQLRTYGLSYRWLLFFILRLIKCFFILRRDKKIR